MTRLTDDDLGDLLTETFTAHEHLADPDRAVAIAASPSNPRHRGRVLFGAAAAVALVAGGTTYAMSGGSTEQPEILGPPSSGHQPPLPVVESNADRRAAARRAAERTLAEVPDYPGARTSPPLAPLGASYVSYGATGDSETLTRWWTVGGVGPHSVAEWFAAHPVRGFVSDGGVGSASGTDSPTVYFVDFHPRGSEQILGAPGQHVLVETTSLPSGVGIRVSVTDVWSPARARASFVQDVTSIDVMSTHTRFGPPVRSTKRSFTITDPQRVLDLARAFDSLEAQAPTGPISCPAMREVYRDRIVFHTQTGDDVVVTTSGTCLDDAAVQRDGKEIPPVLGDVSSFLRALGLDH